jgi:hypothetical protein
MAQVGIYGNFGPGGVVVYADGNHTTPEQFGAIGDGIVDDTLAVQAAINYCSTTTPWTALSLIGTYYVTAPLIIDRPVNTMVADFKIIGLNSSAGFYTDQAIPLFSSSIVDAAAPVSEFINFENVYFSSSAAALAAYVLDGVKFLRVRFDKCRFYQIHFLTTGIYTQSIDINHSSIKNGAGIFWDCNGSMDCAFHGNLIEGIGTAFKSVDAAVYCYGFRFIDNLVEGCDAAPLIITGATGCTFHGNYFELNTGGPQINLNGGALTNRAVSVAGNLFLASAAQIADGAYYAIHWGGLAAGSSTGNYSDAQLHNVSGIGGPDYFLSYGDISLGIPYGNMSLATAGASSELIARSITAPKAYAWRTLATGIFNLRNPDVGTVFISVSPTGEVGINKAAALSKLAVVGLPSYANDAAAGVGGLTTGDFYLETGTNPLRVACKT